MYNYNKTMNFSRNNKIMKICQSLGLYKVLGELIISFEIPQEFIRMRKQIDYESKKSSNFHKNGCFSETDPDNYYYHVSQYNYPLYGPDDNLLHIFLTSAKKSELNYRLRNSWLYLEAEDEMNDVLHPGMIRYGGWNVGLLDRYISQKEEHMLLNFHQEEDA